MNPTILRQVTLPTNLPFDAKPIIDITDELPKNPTTGDWLTYPTVRVDGLRHTGPREYEDIRKIAVHHSGVEGNIYGHADYHVFTKSRPGVCYHLYAKEDQLYQVNDLLALTWHVANNNYDTVSICLEGDFTKRNMTEVECKTLYTGILTLQKYFPRATVEFVQGHNEYPIPEWTACPGFDMERVREDIQSLQEQMKYNDSDSKRRATAFATAERVNDLYNTALNDGEWSGEAVRKLLEVNEFIKSKGWL